jgi:ABC transporter substrate binding protein
VRALTAKWVSVRADIAGHPQIDANDPTETLPARLVVMHNTRRPDVITSAAQGLGRREGPMRRREFTRLLGGATVAWSVAAHAQQTERVRRISVLTFSAENDQEGQSSVAAFRDELRKLGWIEGRNIEIDIRWAAADLELMKRYAKELVTLQPDLILTSSTPAAAAMLQQTRTIPIVFVIVAGAVSWRACRGQAATRLASLPS